MVQWDMGAVLGRDGGTDESMSPQFGITRLGRLMIEVARMRITDAGRKAAEIGRPTALNNDYGR